MAALNIDVPETRDAGDGDEAEKRASFQINLRLLNQDT
jgi:hypothetical protein